MDREKLLKFYSDSWNERSKHHSTQTVERWNERAKHWGEALDEKIDNNKKRNVDIVHCLQNRGVLGKNVSVIDVGAGVGLSAIEFSPYVKDVLCLDFSENMCQIGNQMVINKGIDNISFKCCDFETLDIEKEGYTGKFDLVFSAISPAIRSTKAIEKYLKLSKKYCCNVSFVSRSRNIDTHGHPDFDNFYTLVNLLFLKGYYPEVSYINDETTGSVYGVTLWTV